jgi:hypothetical protein
MAPVKQSQFTRLDGSPVSRCTGTRQFLITQPYIFGYRDEFPASSRLEFLNLHRLTRDLYPPFSQNLPFGNNAKPRLRPIIGRTGECPYKDIVEGDKRGFGERPNRERLRRFIGLPVVTSCARMVTTAFRAIPGTVKQLSIGREGSGRNGKPGVRRLRENLTREARPPKLWRILPIRCLTRLK